MTAAQKIAAATLTQANAWQADSEKFIFCIDLLEISSHQRNADALVEKLEAKFEELLSVA